MAKPKILVLVAMATLGLAACGNTGGGTPAASKPDKVQIAAEGPFTGDQASIGKGALQAIQLAVKDFNKAGGVNGTQVQLLIWDDQHSAQTAQTLQAQGISEEEARRQFTDGAALRRMVAADEVAAACVFLASDAAAAISGEDLNVSAGLVMY